MVETAGLILLLYSATTVFILQILFSLVWLKLQSAGFRPFI